jgi:colanic acid/amylovoran biosynthesis glycosyltransferase
VKNVVHLARWLLPFTASFIRNQIVYHRKYSPSIVYAQRKEGPFYEELSSGYDTFCPFDTAGFDRYLYEKFRILTPDKRVQIMEFIQGKNPDVLHVHYGVDCLIYADIIRELDIPACVSFYGYDCTSFPKRFFGYGKTLLRKNVFYNPGVKAVLAMTEDMKKDLLRLGCPPEKIIVHYYGTETGTFHMKRVYWEKEEVNLLIISSFQERKGHFFLIEAFEQLHRDMGKKARLHIVGDGYLRPAIEKKIAALGLDTIILHGPVKYRSKEHLAFLEMADIFVHPSVTPSNGEKEGIPGAIIEAMAAGLPVISTYHAGIPYIIENEKTGMLVQEYDVFGLANAIRRLTQDATLRETIAKAGQDYAMNYLDIKEKEIELERIYESLIHNSNKRKPVWTGKNTDSF